ncbi:hypothetical protein MVES1_002730 [Malassezia vespertilionis]|uniref:Indoleamine 2,3-dioxygenase n=1 Tax=Malassezia vespertilionis TaxID=2020962 RepID=A0A2N1JB48_9BASI|nr:uncharacterized protein MVES1_002730 [Malassezia vespertilionis]PKI83766.1 hypothetical protein MVES_002578 [Malassezia vespertilionis]WFD07367.1 hypothetical protein MVES1_002730 [Malassezia vespertilionis]
MVQRGHFLDAQSAKDDGRACDAEEDACEEVSSCSTLRQMLAALARSMPKSAYTPMESSARPDTSTLAAADFDVDVRSGFLPPEPPISRLDGPHYDVRTHAASIEPSFWEDMLAWGKAIPIRVGAQYDNAEQTKEAHVWHSAIRAMPVCMPSGAFLSDIRRARRACLVLAFLSHMYIHAQPDLGQYEQDEHKAEEIARVKRSRHGAEGKDDFVSRLPASLAVPWKLVNEQLGLPPVLTYATTVLWNWALEDPAAGMQLSNLRILETFTDTESEAHFYRISLLIELQGVEAITLMRISLNEAFARDALAYQRLASYLTELAATIKKLTRLLADMYTGCDPMTFYHEIRPWFKAGDSMWSYEHGVRRSGWLLEGAEQEWVNWTGPSAGQSTLIHALDLFLDVDHARRKRGAEYDGNSSDTSFMERMQAYMPRYHREFLRHLQYGIQVEPVSGSLRADGAVETSDHPIRSMALLSSLDNADHALVQAYDAALQALRSFRDEHMRIATRYIVKPAKAAAAEEIRGTGGTALIRFLSDCRTNTTNAMVKRHIHNAP